MLLKTGYKLQANDSIFRRNIVYDGWAGVTYNASKGIEVSRMHGAGSNNLIYNNTVVNNGGVGIVF